MESVDPLFNWCRKCGVDTEPGKQWCPDHYWGQLDATENSLGASTYLSLVAGTV